VTPAALPVTPASSPALFEQMRAVLDPRAFPGSWDPLAREAVSPRPLRSVIALVGHRAAGKSRLLPLVCRWTGLPGVDLDRLIEERADRSIAALFATNPQTFRDAEREAFISIRGPAIVATGGGFLSLHADLLRDHTGVLVPITFETYRARLLADATRPRLRPQLSHEEEIVQVYAEREERHAAAETMPLIDFLRASSSRVQWP
jgi:shikimate kinase